MNQLFQKLENVINMLLEPFIRYKQVIYLPIKLKIVFLYTLVKLIIPHMKIVITPINLTIIIQNIYAFC